LKSNSLTPSANRSRKLIRSLVIAFATAGLSAALAAPFVVAASPFNLATLLQSFSKESSAAGSGQNSQTMSVLAPARNIDPKPSVGGGDIALSGGTSLIAEEGLSGTAADVEAQPDSTTISVYTVHKGDSLAGIAKMFGVTSNTIIWANDLKGPIKEGQELVILPIAGVRHTVAKGDTIASLAKKYKADAEEIVQYNALAPGQSLAVGDLIIVPDGEIVTAPTPAPKPKSSGTKGNPLRGGGGPSIPGYYSWPVMGGVLTQGLHGYNGVDIGASTGTGVIAAADGVVIIANGSGAWNGGYGNYIVIRHDNGTQTLYGHLSRVLISSGSYVNQGSTIGLVGSTGKSTGSHLHFEVRGATNPFGR
jgi:LysM repeat protein